MAKSKKIRLLEGLIIGIIFGFLLQKGGATRYNIIISQLLLEDFTVLKIMLSAVVTGMVGIYFLKEINKVKLSPKEGSLVKSIVGGLIFGVGFALLGYCPGTAAGAVGQGNLDALIPGMIGLISGSAFFALLFPRLQGILETGKFTHLTFPERLSLNPWKIIITLFIVIIFFLIVIEYRGL